MRLEVGIKADLISRIFKNAKTEYKLFQRSVQTCSSQPKVLDGAKSKYPLFEYLLLFLYVKWINPQITRCDFFGGRFGRSHKIALGEAMDILIDSELIPQEAPIQHRLSFLYLCYHDRYGFRDDPTLLQKMWYLRAHIVMLDLADGPQAGEPWKWYDYRLTMVIYSWVRHNRKYHGCPKASCNCRRLIDEFGYSIVAFKRLYMALESQVLSELAYVRHSEKAYVPERAPVSLSRAKDAQLYLDPKSTWPKCLLDKVATPNPPSTTPLIRYNTSVPRANIKYPTPPNTVKPPQPTAASTQTNQPIPASTVQPTPSISNSTFTSTSASASASANPNTSAPTADHVMPNHSTTDGKLPPPHPSLPAKPQNATQVQSANVQGIKPSLTASPIGHTAKHQHSQSEGSLSRMNEALRATIPASSSTVSTGVNRPPSPASPASSRFAPPSSVSSGNRTRMFPGSSTEASTQVSQSATGWSTTVNAATTPISNYSTPSMESLGDGSPPSLNKSISNPSNSPTIVKTTPTISAVPPSAPRSMRANLSKAAEANIPTAPKSMRDVRNNGAGVLGLIGGRSRDGLAPAVVLQGVPTGPRGWKNPAVPVQKPSIPDKQVDIPMENVEEKTDEQKSSLVIAWESPTRKSKPDDVLPKRLSSKAFKTGAEYLEKLTSRTPVHRGSAAQAAKDALIAPPIPYTSLGKRSRSETKDDDLVADEEMKAKGGNMTPKSHSPVGTLDSPPTKRAKGLVGRESPTKGLANGGIPRLDDDGDTSIMDTSFQDDGGYGDGVDVDDLAIMASNPQSTSKPAAPVQPIIVLDSDEEPFASKKNIKATTPKSTINTKAVSSIKALPSAAASPKPATPKPATRASAKEMLTKVSEDLAVDPRNPKTVKKDAKGKTVDKNAKPKKAKGTATTVSETRSEKGQTGNEIAEVINQSIHRTRVSTLVEGQSSTAPRVTANEAIKSSRLGSSQKSSITAVNPRSGVTHSSASSAEEQEFDNLVKAILRKGPPYPFISVSAADPDTRLESSIHETQRLINILLGIGLTLDWSMVQIGEGGFAIREEAVPAVFSTLTGRMNSMMKLFQIDFIITPPDSGSEDEEIDEDAATMALSTGANLGASKLQITICDGKPERRRRNCEVEERRLVAMIEAITGQPLEGVTTDMTRALDGDHSVLRIGLSQETSDALKPVIISRLGQAGLMVYRGDVQLAGPIILAGDPKSALKKEFDEEKSFDWKAMRAEVLKMRLPWESSTSAPESPLNSPAFTTSSGHHSRTSSLALHSSVSTPEGIPREESWTSTAYFYSRMATNGRWNYGAPVLDSNSSDEYSDDEAETGTLTDAVW